MATICANKSLLLLCLFSLLVLLSLSPPIVHAMNKLGGQQEISGAQNDLQLEDLAKFALEQHNRRQNSDLKFVGLVSTKQQVVAGVMYHLNLKAASGERIDLYEAKVWVKPWQNFKSLEDFRMIQSSFTPADLGTHLDCPEEVGLQPVSSDDPVVKEAAEEALKGLQQRSNSLIPYELKKVESAHAEMNDESTRFNLLFKVQRGSKEEYFKAEVLRTVVGAWMVKDLRQHHQHADV